MKFLTGQLRIIDSPSAFSSLHYYSYTCIAFLCSTTSRLTRLIRNKENCRIENENANCHYTSRRLTHRRNYRSRGCNSRRCKLSLIDNRSYESSQLKLAKMYKKFVFFFVTILSDNSDDDTRYLRYDES